MMLVSIGILLVVFVDSLCGQDIPIQDNNVVQDPATRQLMEFKNATKVPIGLLTTDSGRPVDIRDTSTINTDLLTNQYFIESLKHSLAERIPERVVHAKGTGAFGYFEVTNDITEYCSAKLFEKIGKKTPLTARFSIGLQNKGGTDLSLPDLRGFAMKFYTDEGNLDLLNIQIPVYVYKDPILFGPILRAFERNAKTNLKDFTASLDILTLNPTSLNGFLWLTSHYGLPRGYRKMNAFPIHTFQIHNKHGDNFFVRFKFLTEQGLESFSVPEALLISGIDPDYFTRDLYNAIENKMYPAWRMEMDVMTEEEIKNIDYDAFDVTRLWRNGTYKIVPIGRIILNRNVDNQFADVEIAAFNPSNLVPGIVGPIDQLFRGRRIAYTNTQIYRIGINRNNVEVNQPKYMKTYDRDGLPPVLCNMKDAPNYFPNSINGPLANVEESRPTKRFVLLEQTSIDLEPAAEFYNKILATQEQKQVLVTNLAFGLVRVTPPVRERFLELLFLTDTDLGTRVSAELAAARVAANTFTSLPSIIPDGNTPLTNSFPVNTSSIFPKSGNA